MVRHVVSMIAAGLVLSVWVLPLTAAQGATVDATQPEAAGKDVETVSLRGFGKIGMVWVEGGCFHMGDTVGDGAPAEKPGHEVCVDGFYLASHEVTVAQFRYFADETGYRTDAEKAGGMQVRDGANWGRKDGASWKAPGFEQEDTQPVVGVSWNDSMRFIEWLSKKTGNSYRLPTEAEWEFAARGGNKAKGFKYAGSNDVDGIAWWKGDSEKRTHPVGMKKPNELGLYDMTGNAGELVADIFDGTYYAASPRENPKGPKAGEEHGLRGGDWTSPPWFLTVYFRGAARPDDIYASTGFRLAMEGKTPGKTGSQEAPRKSAVAEAECGAGVGSKGLVPPPPVAYRDPVSGGDYAWVAGGCYMMGDTFGEGSPDELPVHEVCLDSFYLGKHEVTRAQWEKIMGGEPPKESEANLPVVGISWNDAQAFTQKLSGQSGRKYRLPTEAEWEYAARGGRNGEVFRYAGSDDLDAVAWVAGNSGGTLHPVGRKAPNKLGLFDMTGNAQEWVSDGYAIDYYGNSPRCNPLGPESSPKPGSRGGFVHSDPGLSRFAVTTRFYGESKDKKYAFMGFRLVLEPF